LKENLEGYPERWKNIRKEERRFPVTEKMD